MRFTVHRLGWRGLAPCLGL